MTLGKQEYSDWYNSDGRKTFDIWQRIGTRHPPHE